MDKIPGDLPSNCRRQTNGEELSRRNLNPLKEYPYIKLLNRLMDEDIPPNDDDDRDDDDDDDLTQGNSNSPIYPHSVTISSTEDFACSGPLGFQPIIPDSAAAGPRKKNKNRSTSSSPIFCNFCKNSQDLKMCYLTHSLRDPVTKLLTCPVLRGYICEMCGGTGDNAHTSQHCPLKKNRKFSPH